MKGAAKEFLGSLADGPSVRTLRRRWRSVGRFWVWLLSIAAVAWLGMWMYLIYAETQERHIIDRLEAAGESVEGTIESTTGGGGYGQYRVVFDSGDAPRTETLAAGTNTPDREPGQAVTIRVDPHDPTHIAVGGDTNYAVTPRIVIVNLVIAVPFLAAAGVIVTLVRGRRRRSRAQ